MKTTARALSLAAVAILLAVRLTALERPEITFKIFQFPADKIPRIDGDPSD